MENFLRNTIESTREEALTWTAADGGLTMAASDLLACCSAAEKHLGNNDPQAMVTWAGGWEGAFNCSTGPESDLVSACLRWAKEVIEA